jgi:hypothetical protein
MFWTYVFFEHVCGNIYPLAMARPVGCVVESAGVIKSQCDDDYHRNERKRHMHEDLLVEGIPIL